MANSSRCDYCLNPASQMARLCVHFGDKVVLPNLCLTCLFTCILSAKREVKSEQIEEKGVFYTHHYVPEGLNMTVQN